MNQKAKVKNRIKSFIYLGIFGLSIIVVCLISIFLVKTIKQNRILTETKTQLEYEKELIEQNGKFNEDDYYTVYVKGDYALDNSNTIYVFTK